MFCLEENSYLLEKPDSVALLYKILLHKVLNHIPVKSAPFLFLLL